MNSETWGGGGYGVRVLNLFVAVNGIPLKRTSSTLVALVGDGLREMKAIVLKAFFLLIENKEFNQQRS